LNAPKYRLTIQLFDLLWWLCLAHLYRSFHIYASSAWKILLDTTVR